MFSTAVSITSKYQNQFLFLSFLSSLLLLSQFNYYFSRRPSSHSSTAGASSICFYLCTIFLNSLSINSYPIFKEKNLSRIDIWLLFEQYLKHISTIYHIRQSAEQHQTCHTANMGFLNIQYYWLILKYFSNVVEIEHLTLVIYIDFLCHSQNSFWILSWKKEGEKKTTRVFFHPHAVLSPGFFLPPLRGLPKPGQGL